MLLWYKQMLHTEATLKNRFINGSIKNASVLSTAISFAKKGVFFTILLQW